MPKLKTQAKCYYCQKTYTGSGIGRHLSTHLRKKAEEQPSKKQSYHLKINAGSYFLHLLMPSNLTLKHLDTYFRSIWLECCGHLSAFDYKGPRRTSNWGFDVEEFGLPMRTPLKNIYEKGLQLTYEYDFGSTTTLNITMVNAYQLIESKDIILLTRNEPLKILCHSCNKEAAETLCPEWHDEGFIFCEDCGENHAEQCYTFDNYPSVIVNSPRVGVCAYQGGVIDLKRDGIWEA